MPIGSPAYHKMVVTTWLLNPDDTTVFLSMVHITQDGEAAWSLGSWIGNDVDDAQPWGPVLEKAEQTLQHWAQSHPSLDGRRLIIQTFIGGYTQFLTKAQGMPPEIMTKFDRMKQQYVWDGKQAKVNKEIMRAPLTNGGK